MNKLFAWVYDVIEHERGWGKNHDGYICFVDEQSGKDWVYNKTKDRSILKVPDYYLTWENGRWEPVSEKICEEIKQINFTYTNKLL